MEYNYEVDTKHNATTIWMGENGIMWLLCSNNVASSYRCDPCATESSVQMKWNKIHYFYFILFFFAIMDKVCTFLLYNTLCACRVRKNLELYVHQQFSICCGTREDKLTNPTRDFYYIMYIWGQSRVGNLLFS